MAPLPPITVVPTAGSTNEDVLAWGRAGAPHGAALRAERQVAGRGRRGHSWTSPAGNLYLSVLLRPPVAPERLAGLAAACGLGAVRGLAAAGLSDEVSLKWPNDLLARGRKLAGILVEAARDEAGETFAVCGIGVNAAHAPRELGAVSLAELDPTAPSPAALAEPLRDQIVSSVDAWARSVAALPKQDGPLAPILADYHAHLAWLGSKLVARTPAGDELCRGQLSGVDAWGRACLETPRGPRLFSAEEASLRPV